MQQTLTLENMSCQHCINRVTENLLKLDGVSKVDVNLEQGQALVQTEQPLSQATYQEALSKTIYKVTGLS